jgi:hypothetical protein
VIICDFDFVGISVLPPETNPVLLVDSDAVLSQSIPMESLQTVSRRYTKLLEISNAVQLSQLTASDRPERRWTDPSSSTTVDPVEHVFRGPVGKRAYHGLYYNIYRDSLPIVLIIVR